MGSPYYVPMYAMKVKKQDYDLDPLAEGVNALRERQLKDEVGGLMSGNDLKGASRAAYRGGDIRTGNDLRRMQHSEEDRATTASNRAAAEQNRAAKAQADTDTKARAYVSNMMSTLDPKSETFADDWKHHIGRLRSAGYNVGPEYDDPRTGYQIVLGEVSSYKDRATHENQRRDDDLRQQDIDIRRQETDNRSISRNRNDALRAIKLMRDSTTPEQWQENSGVINAVFGRQVPFNERNVVLAQAEGVASSADEFEPSERDRILGISRDTKIDMARQEELKKRYGEPKRGYKLNPDGTQSVAAQPTKAVDPQMEKAVEAMTSRLDAAEEVILDSGYLTNYAGEKGGIGDAGRAYEDYEMAALGAVYAMSGKQTTNKEMERFLSINKPQWNDRSDTIQVRTGRIKALLNAIYGGMKQGLDYDEAERAAFASGANPPPRERSPARPQNRAGPGEPVSGWSAKRLD